MTRRNSVKTLSLIALLFLSACNLQLGASGTESTGNPVTDQQTQGTATPDIPQVASETPSMTLSPTPDTPRVTVSLETNCRTGPGQPYDILGVLQVGQSAEVIGHSTYGDNWIIKLPSNPSVTCWLWGQYATVTGSWESLPLATQPYTPTPAAGYSVAFLSTWHCDEWYGLNFQLVNTGSVSWKSFRLDLYDATTTQTYFLSSDLFKEYTGCAPSVGDLQDLEPGEGGVTGSWGAALIAGNPAGHSITATFRLCSLDGLGGQCMDKSITFTP
jgi:hypothetical protein